MVKTHWAYWAYWAYWALGGRTFTKPLPNITKFGNLSQVWWLVYTVSYHI